VFRLVGTRFFYHVKQPEKNVTGIPGALFLMIRQRDIYCTIQTYLKNLTSTRLQKQQLPVSKLEKARDIKHCA